MSYLITGATGFVGHHLAAHLRAVDATATIIGVDRVAAPPELPVTRAHVVDLLDVERLTEILADERPDHLIHLASYSSVGFSWQQPIASFTNNTNIFLNVLECVRRVTPSTRVLSVGSSEQYGLVTEHALPLVETAPLRPISPYAVARVAQEHLGEVYARGYRLDVVATRSFNHVGPGQTDQFVVSALGKQFAELVAGTRTALSVGATSVVRDFLDVRDVVTAYVALLQRGRAGEVYNVCSGRGVSIAQVIAMYADLAGIEPAIAVDPGLLRPVENTIVIGSHDKITSELGWSPQHALESSLREVLGYWRSRL